MDKFSNTYSVRGSELAPDYRLRNFYVCSYFQECFAEFMTSKKMAGYDMQKVGLTWLMSDISAEICGTLPFWRTPVKVEIWTREINPIFVVVNFLLKDGEQTFATDKKTESSNGERTTESSRDESVVLVDGDSGDTGLLVQTIAPMIRGVAVVCEGGGSAAVKREVTETVSAALGLSREKIYVAKMKNEE